MQSSSISSRNPDVQLVSLAMVADQRSQGESSEVGDGVIIVVNVVVELDAVVSGKIVIRVERWAGLYILGGGRECTNLARTWR